MLNNKKMWNKKDTSKTRNQNERMRFFQLISLFIYRWEPLSTEEREAEKAKVRINSRMQCQMNKQKYAETVAAAA